MKTPKRNHKIPTERQHLDIEPDSWEEDYKQQDTRWKRKNRIAQFKRSLSMYKGGDFLPWYTAERHAYLLIQKLRRPSDEADVHALNLYTQALTEISRLIERAVESSAFRAGMAWQRKYRKETT